MYFTFLAGFSSLVVGETYIGFGRKKLKSSHGSSIGYAVRSSKQYSTQII